MTRKALLYAHLEEMKKADIVPVHSHAYSVVDLSADLACPDHGVNPQPLTRFPSGNQTSLPYLAQRAMR